MSKYNVNSKADLDDGKLNINYSQDVDATIDSVKRMRDEDGGNKQHFKHAARIPQVEMMKWGQEDCGNPLAYLQGRHNKDPELAAKLVQRLNNREFEQLRIWQGRLATSDVVRDGNKMRK